MKTQNFKNHSKTPLRYVLGLLLSLTLLIWSIVNSVKYFSSENLFLTVFSFAFLIISLYVRSFATGNQDRIIRLEMRYRFHLLTGIRFESLEQKLSINQIVALRFASNEELEALTNKAIEGQLTPKEIKLSIKNWQADFQRI